VTRELAIFFLGAVSCYLATTGCFIFSIVESELGFPKEERFSIRFVLKAFNWPVGMRGFGRGFSAGIREAIKDEQKGSLP
jgi:hypothetical protein